MMNPIYIQGMSALDPQTGNRKDRCLPQERRLIAVEPDYKVCIPDAGLRRRMSRIVKMGVAAAMACLKDDEPATVDAIITATGLGCLGDTEKFMNSVLDNDERLLNPTAFIQSTFNTIGAQIALLCKNHGYNMTYVHRGFSFESALLDAQMMLSEGDARRVLVGGVDEITESAWRIMERMGFWKHTSAGEGAHFFIFGAKKEPALGKIRGMMTFRGPSTRRTIRDQIRLFLEIQRVYPEEVDIVLCGDEKSGVLFPGVPTVEFKRYCGEYPTASAFALWLGTFLLQGKGIWDIPNREIRKILIYNNYHDVNHTLILLEKEI